MIFIALLILSFHNDIYLALSTRLRVTKHKSRDFGNTSAGILEPAPLPSTCDFGRVAIFCHWKNFKWHDRNKCQELKFSSQQMLKAHCEQNVVFNILEKPNISKKGSLRSPYC